MPLDDPDSELEYKLTVIIAEEMAVANCTEIFEHLQPECHLDVEFLVCSASDASLINSIPQAINVHVIPAHPDTRIPVLWRNGIRQAKADKIALTTAQCIPSRQWLEQLLEYDLTENLVAVGGAIENGTNDNHVGRAIYLLRYVNYTNARASGDVIDIAADNALYRKADILKHEDLLAIGFWEPSFHKRFISDGMNIQFDNRLIVVHRNCYSVKQFMNQRFSHGIEFGMERAKSMTLTKRMIMIVLSPLIPLVFLRKILHKAKLDKQFKLGLNLDFFWLFVFILAWSFGEATGYVKRSDV